MTGNHPRVLHVAQRDDPATGGAVRVAFEFVSRLPDHGVDSHLLFLYGESGPFGDLLGDRAYYLHISNSRRLDQLARLNSFLRRFRPDVVHFHDDLLWPQLLNAGARPWVTVIHAHGGGTPRPQPWKTRALYALQRRHADRVICITEEAKTSQHINVGVDARRMAVIYNGVDQGVYRAFSVEEQKLARQELGLPNAKVVLGFVGRLHDAMKGCLDFVDLIAATPADHIGLVAGAGPDADAMRLRADALGVSDRLFLLGSLNSPVSAYRAMDVFCFLSRHEPFGLTIAEAMSSGVPVVGFACPGGSGELLTDQTGFVVGERDIAAMAKTVGLAVRSDGPSRDRRGAATRLISERHDWHRSARLLRDVYEDALTEFKWPKR